MGREKIGKVFLALKGKLKSTGKSMIFFTIIFHLNNCNILYFYQI